MAHKELEDYTREDAMTHLHSMFNVINKLQKDYDRRRLQSLSQYSNFVGLKSMNGAKFICRKTEDNKIRVWRIK